MHNPFVIDAVEALSLPQPDIEVRLQRQFAQCSEDLIVVSLLRALAERGGFELKSKRYLEIGANHPVATSATSLMYLENEMRGVWVEANPALIANLQDCRAGDIIEHVAIHASDEATADLVVSQQNEISSLNREFVEAWRDGEVGIRGVETVPAMRVNALLEKHFQQEAPIFLSVDVESLDLEILQDVDWSRWRPAIVQAEPSGQFIQGNDAAIRDFMASQNYILAAQTHVNQIFIDRSVALNGVLPRIMSGEGEIDITNSQPSVGVVMRTKDRSVLLRRALESVKHQTYSNWQLVIVNDAGDKEPVDWLVGEIFAGDGRVRVLHRENSCGMEAASNAGLHLLGTDYAVIHDDDDSWAPEFLSMMVATIVRERQAHRSIKGVVCRVVNIFERVIGNEILIDDVSAYQPHHSDHLNEGFLSLKSMMMRNQFPPIAFIFDLAEAKSLGLFDETLPVLGDWDFHLKFLSKNDIWILPENLAFYHHRLSASGAMGNSITAGVKSHSLYTQMIKNRQLRTALNGDPKLHAAMVMIAETQQTATNETAHILWRIQQLEEDNRRLFGEMPKELRRQIRPKWRKIGSKVVRKVRSVLFGRKGK